MTPQEAAAALNGNQYTKEGSKELWAAMKAAGLVAVFAASDDLVELEDKCPNWTPRGKPVEAIWCPEGDGEGSWGFKTEIPHVTFDIMEDDDLFCRGLVFALKDAA